MHNAFSLTAEALGLNDLLIDDVMTTDKRLENVAGPCSSVAAEVQVAVVGRA